MAVAINWILLNMTIKVWNCLIKNSIKNMLVVLIIKY